MTIQENAQIKILKDALSDKFGTKQVFIFGSHAYGTPDQESDIDICVITNLKHKRKIEIMREIRQALLNLIYGPIDILVYYEEEFKERSRLKSTLEYKILTDGMPLYG